MSWLSLPRVIAVLLGVSASAAALLYVTRKPQANDAPTPAPTNLVVPHASAEFVVDGKLDEAAWATSSARTDVFVGPNGEPGRPHADARFVWRDGTLYVGLYAADRDIRASRAPGDGPRWLNGDTFELIFAAPDGAEFRFDVSPDGTLSDARRIPSGWDYSWQSGARTGHDADGTVNNPSDEDEEWVVEMAVPLAALGIASGKDATLGVTIRRCDVTATGSRECTSWNDHGVHRVLKLD